VGLPENIRDRARDAAEIEIRREISKYYIFVKPLAVHFIAAVLQM
jgi:hypothetical protein